MKQKNIQGMKKKTKKPMSSKQNNMTTAKNRLVKKNVPKKIIAATKLKNAQNQSMISWTASKVCL